MPTYLTPTEFRSESTMPSAFVDALESVSPGFLSARLASASALVDSRLAKRYAVPFSTPYPLTVRRWIAAIVTKEAYLRRGIDPNDPHYDAIRLESEAALKDLDEAANSNEGRYELPMRQDVSASGVSRGGPFGYSESSPYVWMDAQASAARDEDRRGGGT